MKTGNLPLSKQIALLQNCIEDDLRLSDVLSTNGYTYDDLRYRHNKGITHNNPTYQTIADVPMQRHGIPTVGFFSGAGGLDLGFERAGFEHLASFEINDLFCETMRMNRPDWHVFTEDVRQRDQITAILSEKVGLKAPFEGVFHGGPPCQPFSIAANQRFTKSGDNFKRIGFDHDENGNLLFDYIWQIKMFRPAVFLIENVPGLMTMDDGQQLADALKSVRNIGYEIAKPTILNTRYYNVPQSRERLFIIGWRKTGRQFQFPTQSLFEVPCDVALRDVETLSNHATRKHKAASILRYMELGYGKRDQVGRVDRLDPNLPSKTVIAGGMKGGGRSHLHPFIPRTLSPRESARLQTFPDDYQFCGSPARQLTQVGNAVPPLLGWQIANAICETLFCVK